MTEIHNNSVLISNHKNTVQTDRFRVVAHARTVNPEEAIEVVAKMIAEGEPAVLVTVEDTGHVWDGVVGIITAFDLMTLTL